MVRGATTGGNLLGPADHPAVDIVNPYGPSPFLLIGDHAGCDMPRAVGTLGLAPRELEQIIAELPSDFTASLRRLSPAAVATRQAR